MPAIMIMYDVCNQTNCMCDEFDTVMCHPLVLPPTGLSAVHTSTTIRVYWTPPTATPTGYEITYFPGAGDITGTAVPVGGDSTDSSEITGLSATVTYRVSIVSVNGATRSATTGPVLAVRGKYTFISSLFLIFVGYGIHENIVLTKMSRQYWIYVQMSIGVLIPAADLPYSTMQGNVTSQNSNAVILPA